MASAKEDATAITAVEEQTEEVEQYLTRPGSRLGTVPYMSPEQVQAQELDARSDLFSYGVVLYEMATGALPFEGASTAEIFRAILTSTPTPATRLNAALPPKLESVIDRCLQKDRSQRYASASVVREDLLQVKGVTKSGRRRFSRTPWIVGVIVLATALILGWVYTRPAHALTKTDTVVLADFANKTTDPIFDETLYQGFAAQLRQSPFLSLVSEQRIQQELRLMGVPPDTKLTPKIAGDLCQRLGSKAYLGGSISNIGSQYVIGVNAVNCQSGDSIAQEQLTANGKEAVLSALGTASTRLREQLGEALKTIQELDTPIEQATTPSLEALQAYSMGRRNMVVKGDYTAAIPLLERSIQLDPNFAMAYAILGTTYHNLGEQTLSADNTGKAFALRSHVSEWERFYIESHYYDFVTGDLENAIKVYELWAQIYPREAVAPTNLGVIFQTLGQHEKALVEFREAVRIGPQDILGYTNLVLGNLYLRHIDEAQAAADEAISKNFNSAALRTSLYDLAFAKSDVPGMAEQVSWAAGKPGSESVMLSSESGTAAYEGKLVKARDLSRRASTSAQRAGDKEMSADCEAAAALWEALYGNASEARQRVAKSLTKVNGRDVQYVAALALALIGDSARAKSLTGDLDKRFPEDTVVRFNYLPTLRAQLALPGNGAKAVEILAAASPYELGVPGSRTLRTNLYPIYVRGEALLTSRQGALAATEFQKILDWPGVVINEPIGALARLGLGRAYALADNSAKARAAYEGFFRLWNEADPDIPILKQAKTEYAKLP